MERVEGVRDDQRREIPTERYEARERTGNNKKNREDEEKKSKDKRERQLKEDQREEE